MKLYRTASGIVVEHEDVLRLVEGVEWDEIMACDDPAPLLARVLQSATRIRTGGARPGVTARADRHAGSLGGRRHLLPQPHGPDGGGESRRAAAISTTASTAPPRPELFFKATPHGVSSGRASPCASGATRGGACPSPSLRWRSTPAAAIIGYTIGNDMSARDIEGENPLYLPQAKVYDGELRARPVHAADERGPAARDRRSSSRFDVRGTLAFAGTTTLASLKRGVQELADYLFRDNVFPSGCILLTGTGIVPPDDFTLQSGDIITIAIPPIGTLENTVR